MNLSATTRSAPPTPVGHPTVAIVGSPTKASDLLAHRWRAYGIDAMVLDPDSALERLGPGDVALVRLDVLPTLDGIEPGLDQVRELAHRGVHVLNRPEALLAMHDKLRTARTLAAAGIPHPTTVHVPAAGPVPAVPVPGVLKPRFGSWGRDVVRYDSREAFEDAVAWAATRVWWPGHGALAQELVDAPSHDLRIVVADSRAVGAATRIARGGEWRTNVSLGARLVPTLLPGEAAALAVAAVAAIGADLGGVDLLEAPDGWVVLELNGAVDFDERYDQPGEDVFAGIALALALPCAPITPIREESTMPKTMQGEPAQPGDVIEITGHAVGDAPRTAEIVEVLGEPGHEHFRVRWEDGHESIFFPGEDAQVIRPKARKPKPAKA